MTALSRRGLVVQPFKCGPDFLDAMHHEAAIDAGVAQETTSLKSLNRKTINLDGWMMGGKAAIIDSFLRHSQQADVCVIEGCMGLYDSKDGTSDDGSSAQIAKYLNASVLLVIDAGMMARSVAPMALGYANYDPEVNLDAVVVNKVGGSVHVQWIKEALEDLNLNTKLQQQLDLKFVGGMVKDQSVAIPERHLGLTMPTEEDPSLRKERFLRLATQIEQHLDLDVILTLGRQRGRKFLDSLGLPSPLAPTISPPKQCRIGVAQDEAFCFYYADNLSLLESIGAEIVPFSPIHDNRLPKCLDGLYLGGGYPELHAETLQSNVSMRRDILSFANAGGLVYAECGGMMYLAAALFTAKDKPKYDMCAVFPNVDTRMTPHMKMHYAELEFTNSNPIFPPGTKCRGQKFHFSELVVEEDTSQETQHFPIKATPQTVIDVEPEKVGLMHKNTVASYYHLHFASNPEMANQLVQKIIECSPCRHHTAVSFVSAATEIVFALQAEAKLAGVTSLCDYPIEAQCAPRHIVCRSSIDASQMTSEEVDAAMKEIKRRSEEESDSGPGIWHVDAETLKNIAPKVVFVQSTCDICDPRKDDVLMALQSTGLDDTGIQVVPVAPTTLEGLFTSIGDVAIALGCEQSGANLTRELRQRLQVVEDALDNATRPPSVLSLEGLAPICTGGNWLPDIKAAAGCRDALGDKGGANARILKWDEILAVDPDVLILSPCSASPQRTLKELHLLASEPSFWELRCVQQGDVYIIDHNRFSRPGPRLVSGVEMLATLLRKIPPPPGAGKEWANEVLKYECSIEDNNDIGISHCTTELAGRFKPVFAGSSTPTQEKDYNIQQNAGLSACVITRCTIPNYPHPEPRSAHCMIALPANGLSKRSSLLIFSGEGNGSKRLKDMWQLYLPSDRCAQGSQSDEDVPLPLESNCIWEWLGRRVSSIANEDVPSYRSNSAAVVCGKDHLLVFGGWGKDNVTPLSACELLHLKTFCWTHCSTRGGTEPPPRGNPTLVYSRCNNQAILFAGWNRVQRLNDLWCLDLDTWNWKRVMNPTSKCGQGNWPTNRTDHSAVLWQKSDKEDIMLVYGGSVESTGASGELWRLDCSHRDSRQWAWDQVHIHGPEPPGRSSHTAAIVGTGPTASMIILGGSDALKGCAKSGIVGDAWVLQNLGIEEKLCWIKLPWYGHGVERCRHTMTVIGSDVVVWGGFDGETNVNDEIKVWVGSLEIGDADSSLSNALTERKNITQAESSGFQGHSAKLQERWEAEIPVRQEDLPPEILEKAKKSTLPNALAKAMHRHAVSKGKDTYIDPASGYSVFTQLYLKRRSCCGNGCRHCPYGHKNVPKSKDDESDDDRCSSDPKLDW
jgi:cobyrinic acid a,c-diamide synthase